MTTNKSIKSKFIKIVYSKNFEKQHTRTKENKISRRLKRTWSIIRLTTTVNHRSKAGIKVSKPQNLTKIHLNKKKSQDITAMHNILPYRGPVETSHDSGKHYL